MTISTINMIIMLILIIILLIIINHKKSSSVTIINLVLYSNNDEYNEMYKLTREYYKKFNNVKTIYYKFDETISKEYELNDDILNIKGKETFIPGILDKTIKAFQFVNDHYNFNYVVRSNISTLVDFNLLTKYLEHNQIDYGGGLKLSLYEISQSYGIKDSTYFGTEYASGTSIIISKKLLSNIINNKNKIKYNFIDDVALGLFVSENKNDIIIKYVPDKHFIMIKSYEDQSELINDIKDKEYIFYRNRQTDRKMDLLQMKTIINQ
jgi:hypothetical protein